MEPAPGSQFEPEALTLPQPSFAFTHKQLITTHSSARASTRGREPHLQTQEVLLLQAEPLAPQPALFFSPETLDSKAPTVKRRRRKGRSSAATIKRHVKEPTNSETQALSGEDTISSNPNLLPQLFPSVAPFTDVEPAPPSRPPDGPIVPPPIPLPPAALLTPPYSPPTTPGPGPSKEPSHPAKDWSDLDKLSPEKGWPELKNEPMAPATKDRKSRFFPQLNPIIPLANSASNGTGLRKKFKPSPPPPLDLVTVSLASPIDDESPVLGRASVGTDIRGGSKRKASWWLWGNDMSHLRLKTGGFVDWGRWVTDGKADVGEEKLYESEGERRWSLGEEWEVVEVE